MSFWRYLRCDLMGKQYYFPVCLSLQTENKSSDICLVSTQRIPTHEMKLLIKDLGASVLIFSRIPHFHPTPETGTSHGGLRHFSSELLNNTPYQHIWTFHGGLRHFSPELLKNNPPPPTKLGLSMEDLGT